MRWLERIHVVFMPPRPQVIDLFISVIDFIYESWGHWKLQMDLLTPITAGSSCTLRRGCGSSTARSFTSEARNMMYAYGSCTGGMNWSAGLNNNVSTTRSYKYHAICQKEDYGEIHRVSRTSSKAHAHPYWIHRQYRHGGTTHRLDSVPME